MAEGFSGHVELESVSSLIEPESLLGLARLLHLEVVQVGFD